MRSKSLSIALSLLVSVLFFTESVQAAETPFRFGQRIHSTLQAEDEVTIDIAVIEDSVAKFKCTGWKGTGFLPEIELRSPEGEVVALGARLKIVKKGRGLKLLKLPLWETGVYQLTIRGRDGTAGSFDLVLKGKYPKKLKFIEPGQNPTGTLPVRFGALPQDLVKIKLKALAKFLPVVVKFTDASGDETMLNSPRKAGPIPVRDLGVQTFEIGGSTGATYSFKATINLKRRKASKAWVEVDPIVPKGSISGRVLVEGHGGGAPKMKSSSPAPAGEGDVAVGEIIVSAPGARDPDEVCAALAAAIPNMEYEVVHSMTDEGPHLVRVVGLADRTPSRRLKQKTRTVGKALSVAPGVRYAEPNAIHRAFKEPNDNLWEEQYHYRDMNLPGAWEITTGSADVVVAVVDTGIWSHPDLSGRILPGYDFVGNAQNAMDGGGWDSDPTDAHHSFHGTHVAGTIGASTDNRVGVAGVTWNCGIVPVRVLGEKGGATYDILSGVRWASGLSVSGVPTNSNPADVINMSLGGGGYSQAFQDAINAAVDAGVVVVAAAGNQNTSSLHYPAAYDNVICVAAVAPNMTRASYSNYGSWIHVSAPGGDLSRGMAGILSTYASDWTLSPTYGSIQGTSMACPHVAGVAALVRSVDSTLTHSDVDQLLQDTAIDLGASGFDTQFGAGMVDAEAAVREAAGTAGGDPSLWSTPESLEFGSGVAGAWIYLLNLGGGSISVDQVTVRTDQGSGWLSAQAQQNQVPTGVLVSVDRFGLAEGVYTGSVTIVTSLETLVVPIRVVKKQPVDIGDVQVRLLDSDGYLVDQTTATAAGGYAYSFAELPLGEYEVEALADMDGDGQLDRIDEWYGAWPVAQAPELVEISRGTPDRTDQNFSIARADTWFTFHGSGGGPIQGAVAVWVTDGDTGEPLAGAKAFTKTSSATTDEWGRAILAADSPTGIYVTVDGYGSGAQVGSDSQFQSFALGSLAGPETVEISVWIEDLEWTDYWVYVRIGNSREWEYHDGSGYVLTSLDVPKNQADLAVSVIVFDDDYVPLKMDFDLLDAIETDNPEDLEYYPWDPVDGWYHQFPTVRLPSANFTELGSDIEATFNLYWTDNDVSTLSISSLDSDVRGDLYWPSLGIFDELIYGTITYSAYDLKGRRSHHYVTSTFDDFPGYPVVHLYRPPALLTPADGALYSGAPVTLTFTPTPGSHLNIVFILDETDGTEWYFWTQDSFVELWNMPNGGLKPGHEYTWQVSSVVIPEFTLEDYLDSATTTDLTDWATSEWRTFEMRSP